MPDARDGEQRSQDTDDNDRRAKEFAIEVAHELMRIWSRGISREEAPDPGRKREPWMTTAEAAKHAKVTEDTIRDWVRRGWLRAGRNGRELRFRPEELDAFLERDQGDGEPAVENDDVPDRVLEILAGEEVP